MFVRRDAGGGVALELDDRGKKVLFERVAP
jgi:hypothetical protein